MCVSHFHNELVPSFDCKNKPWQYLIHWNENDAGWASL
jgi:hypothetical protein